MKLLQEVAKCWVDRYRDKDAPEEWKRAAMSQPRICFEFFIGAGAALQMADHPEAEQFCDMVRILRHVQLPDVMVEEWAKGECMVKPVG